MDILDVDLWSRPWTLRFGFVASQHQLTVNFVNIKIESIYLLEKIMQDDGSVADLQDVGRDVDLVVCELRPFVPLVVLRLDGAVLVVSLLAVLVDLVLGTLVGRVVVLVQRDERPNPAGKIPIC